MTIKYASESVNFREAQRFGSKRVILNPVQDEIKKSGIKLTSKEYDNLSMEKYMTKEEIRAFKSLPPSQQKRITAVFFQTPEYKKLKKEIERNSSGNTQEDNYIFSVGSKNNKSSVSDKSYSQKNYGNNDTGGKIVETRNFNKELAKDAAKDVKNLSENANEAGQAGAAAGSGGVSKIVKESTEAAKKYAELLKEASGNERTDHSDYKEEHSSDIAISKSEMGIMQKITAMIMAIAAAILSQVGIIFLPLILIITVVVIVTTIVLTVISSVGDVIKETAISGLKKQMLSEQTIAYTQDVEKAAAGTGMEAYVNYLMAIMEVESGGSGTDVMQSSESAGLPANSFKTPGESIVQGVLHFSNCVKAANEKGCDINTAVQAYNYGTGFVDYVAENGQVYSLELAISFAQEKSGGTQKEYKNQIAIDYNGGWRYAYGNMFYAQLINQYVYSYDDVTVQKIVDEAMKYSGWDYIYGGSSPYDGGFDCSGLVQYVYAQAGITLPRTSQEQYAASQEISYDDIKPGDLIFYKNETSNGGIGHVAIYIGSGQVFEAGDPIGVYKSMDAWHKDNMLHVGRVLNNS